MVTPSPLDKPRLPCTSVTWWSPSHWSNHAYLVNLWHNDPLPTGQTTPTLYICDMMTPSPLVKPRLPCTSVTWWSPPHWSNQPDQYSVTIRGKFWLMLAIFWKRTIPSFMWSKFAVGSASENFKKELIRPWATSSGSKVRTIVTLVPAEQGRKRVKWRQLNFDPYPSRTHAGPRVTLVATHVHVLPLRRWKWFGIWKWK